MQIYIAHNFAAREWLPRLIRQIHILTPHRVNSTWVYDDSHAQGGSRLVSAQTDINDMDISSCVVLFVNQYGDTPGKGKYFELGYAYATQKRIILVGKDEGCVFFHLPGIQRVSDTKELMALLVGEKA